VVEIGGVGVIFIGLDFDVTGAAADRDRLVSRGHGHGPVLLHLDGLVVFHFGGHVVFHHFVLILGGVGEDLLLPFEILETYFVEVAAPLAGVGHDGALGLFGGQVVGRFVLAVLHTAGDDGAVRVAVQKIDNHLLADL